MKFYRKGRKKLVRKRSNSTIKTSMAKYKANRNSYCASNWIEYPGCDPRVVKRSYHPTSSTAKKVAKDRHNYYKANEDTERTGLWYEIDKVDSRLKYKTFRKK